MSADTINILLALGFFITGAVFISCSKSKRFLDAYTKFDDKIPLFRHIKISKRYSLSKEMRYTGMLMLISAAVIALYFLFD